MLLASTDQSGVAASVRLCHIALNLPLLVAIAARVHHVLHVSPGVDLHPTCNTHESLAQRHWQRKYVLLAGEER